MQLPRELISAWTLAGGSSAAVFQTSCLSSAMDAASALLLMGCCIKTSISPLFEAAAGDHRWSTHLHRFLLLFR